MVKNYGERFQISDGLICMLEFLREIYSVNLT